MTRARKIILWSGGVTAFLLLSVLAVLSWLLFTTAGARWVAGVATARFAPQVKYGAIEGTIAGELIVTDFRFEGAADAAKIRIAKLSVDPTLRMLFSRVLRIERASVEGLIVILPADEKPDTDEPLWLEPPLDVVVNDFALRDGRILKDNETLVTVKQLGVAARWSRDVLLIDRLTLLPGEVKGELSVKGRVMPAGKSLRGVLDAHWKDVVIPAELAGQVVATRGELHFDGTPLEYSAKGNAEVTVARETTRVLLDVSGTDARAQLHTVNLTQRAGRLAVQGEVVFAPLSWDLTARADDFNPGAFLAQFPGKVNLDLAMRGEFTDAGPSGTVKIAELSGVLRGRPISGGGELKLVAPAELSGDLSVNSGKSRLAVKGRATGKQQMDATVVLSVASLGDWVPQTSGSLLGNFRVRGVWPKLSIAGTADGKALAMAGVKISKLHLDAAVDSPLDPNGKFEAVASKVAVAGQEFAAITLHATGNQAKHRVAVEADSDRYDGVVELAGGLTNTGWRGDLTRFEFVAADIASLKLREPSHITYDSASFSLSQTCLDDAPMVLCAAAKLEASGALDAGYSFEHVPLKLANSIAPTALASELRGEVAGHGRVRQGVDGQWLGDLAVTSESARLVMGDSAEGALAAVSQQGTLLLYENLDLQADFAGMKLTSKLTADLEHGGKISANLTASDLNAQAIRLAGDIDASMPTLAPFSVFIPSVANLDGAVQAKIRVGGTNTAPEFTGNVDATRLQADLGQLGIELREGEMRGEAARGGGFRLAGQVKSGAGRLEFKGSLDERGVADVHIGGQNFLAADIPAANVVVTPDLSLTGDRKGYLLKGEVTIPSAAINLQKLPQDEPPGVSPDVVVIREGKVVSHAAEGAALPLSAVVTVKFADKVAITGFGLDATVAGQLLVREAPGAAATGSGQLTLAGRYKAYGQDLTIKDGRLLFAGTPLDNPRLSIVAMREVNDKLSTGLRVAGSAQRPIVTVISQPEVGEADALSYLVTGRSLSDVGSASGSSQDALASATRSLEGAAGGLVAKRIGKRLGLDEAGVEENDMIGGSALTIGEYLSPRLYLSYGIGLFEPGEVIALRYKLSADVGVKVQRGSQETRAGVEYRIEK